MSVGGRDEERCVRVSGRDEERSCIQRVHVCFVKILNNAIGDLLTSRMPEEAPKQDIETFNNPLA